MKVVSCEFCSNRECFLYRNCNSEWYTELDANKTCYQVPKDYDLFEEGNPVEGVLFLHSGIVKVSKASPYRRQIVRLASGGDILGNHGFEENSLYQNSATTIDECRVCYVEKGFLVRLMKHNPVLSMEMMKYHVEELRKTETHLRNMAVMTVRERVADALLMVLYAFGGDTSKGIAFSRKDIAEIAGTYADQISRYISEFKQEGILKVEGRKIMVINLGKLQDIVKRYNDFQSSTNPA